MSVLFSFPSERLAPRFLDTRLHIYVLLVPNFKLYECIPDADSRLIRLLCSLLTTNVQEDILYFYDVFIHYCLCIRIYYLFR